MPMAMAARSILVLIKEKMYQYNQLGIFPKMIISWFIRKYELHIIHAQKCKKYLFLFHESCIYASKAQALIQ